MRVIKNINNNVAICIDSNGHSVVAFGKGIGYKKAPYDIELSKIERTYYDVDQNYVQMINDIPDSIMSVSNMVIDYARSKIDKQISSNIIFTLADHINFSIDRYKKNLSISMPLVYDIQNIYVKEMDVGQYALKLIKDELKVNLPKEEAAFIALHIVNAEASKKSQEEIYTEEKIIDDITDIVESYYNIIINRNNFNYSRFVSHMYYLLKRGKENIALDTSNKEMYKQFSKEYPKAYDCVNRISSYLSSTIALDLTEEEKLYLMIHTNRLTSREDDN